MSTEQPLEQQLADYFGWLEQHLGSTMRHPDARGIVAAPSARRWQVLAGLAVCAALVIAAVVWVGRDDDRSVMPASTDPAEPGTSSTRDSAGSTEPEQEPVTWAPIDLPDGWRIVDVGRRVDFPNGQISETYVVGDEGDPQWISIEITLADPWVKVWVPQATIHDQPAVLTQVTSNEFDGFESWWTENGYRVAVYGGGIDIEAAADLLDQLRWLGVDPGSGIDATSLPGARLIRRRDGTAPNLVDWYVVAGPAGQFALVNVGSAPPWRWDVSYGTPAPLATRFGDGTIINAEATLTMADGTVVVVQPLHPGELSPDEATQIATSIGPADAAQRARIEGQLQTWLAAFPVVAEVTVDGIELQLRGPTADAPVAACVQLSPTSSSCGWNELHAFGLEGVGIKVDVGGRWFQVQTGAGQEALAARCASTVAGEVTSDLAGTTVDDGGTTWRLTEIPADVDLVAVCGADGVVSSSAAVRPGVRPSV